jgi:hypothetical protein
LGQLRVYRCISIQNSGDGGGGCTAKPCVRQRSL